MALHFYHGPVSSITVNANNIGECKDVLIKWEPSGPETMDKNLVQSGGTGTFECKAMQAGSTVLAYLQAAKNTRVSVVVTTADGKTYTMTNLIVNYGFSAPLNETEETTTFDISSTKWTSTPDGFVTVQSDS